MSAECLLEVTVSSAWVLYIPSRLMSSWAAASTAPCPEQGWTDLFPLWTHTIGWAVSAPFSPPSSPAAVEAGVGGAAQRGGHACMHWLVPVSAISGGEGVDGMSGGSHSSRTPCRRECMGDKVTS